jgi:hypothetical protein
MDEANFGNDLATLNECSREWADLTPEIAADGMVCLGSRAVLFLLVQYDYVASIEIFLVLTRLPTNCELSLTLNRSWLPSVVGFTRENSGQIHFWVHGN